MTIRRYSCRLKQNTIFRELKLTFVTCHNFVNKRYTDSSTIIIITNNFVLFFVVFYLTASRQFESKTFQIKVNPNSIKKPIKKFIKSAKYPKLHNRITNKQITSNTLIHYRIFTKYIRTS